MTKETTHEGRMKTTKQKWTALGMKRMMKSIFLFINLKVFCFNSGAFGILTHATLCQSLIIFSSCKFCLTSLQEIHDNSVCIWVHIYKAFWHQCFLFPFYFITIIKSQFIGLDCLKNLHPYNFNFCLAVLEHLLSCGKKFSILFKQTNKLKS